MDTHPIETPESPGKDDHSVIRARLNSHKQACKLSWSTLGERIGIAGSTLSLFGSGNYTGDNDRIAVQVAKWFAAEAVQAAARAAAPIAVPNFQATKAAGEITNLLRWAQRGKMVFAATCPGFGKTSAAVQYQNDVPNVWLATMKPSTAGVATMLAQVLRAMGERDARGSPQMLTARIEDRVARTNGLIIIDDAQHLSEKALEELRGIHDVTGIGIALLGNAGLRERLEGGSRAVAFAQLFSRISLPITRKHAYAEDGQMMGRAWGVEDDRALGWLGEMALQPGGLRQISMALELAAITASGAGRRIAANDLKSAWVQLTQRAAA